MSAKQSVSTLSNMKSNKHRLICVVCGSIARGYNFGSVTCMSCKIFFRRNAFTNINKFICQQRGNCVITPQTRRYCTYCRLLSCFRMGMRREFIRKHKEPMKVLIHPNQQFRINYSNVHKLPNGHRMFNHAILSNDDWFLLRQLSLNFDTLNYPVISTADEIRRQTLSIGIQPIKMRAKASYIYDMANTFTYFLLKYIGCIPQFNSLPYINKQAILRRNTRLVMVYYSHYQIGMKPFSSLIQTPYWLSSFDCIILPSTKRLHMNLNHHIQNISKVDRYLNNLILALLTFTQNNIDYNRLALAHNFDENQHGLILFTIQSNFLEIMWKYMIYRFGESTAVLLFSDVVKAILEVQLVAYQMTESIVPWEKKFYENFMKIIEEHLQVQ